MHEFPTTDRQGIPPDAFDTVVLSPFQPPRLKRQKFTSAVDGSVNRVLSIDYYGCAMVIGNIPCRLVKLLTTKDAAKRLGVSDGRVRAMILAGHSPAEKFGRAHLIREQDLELVKNRKPGRPRINKIGARKGTTRAGKR